MLDKDILNEAIFFYGTKNQITKAVEEMSELQKELCKYLIATNTGDYSYPHIAEEIADVEIMVEQLKIIFRNEAEVKKMKEFKLKRLWDSIEL